MKKNILFCIIVMIILYAIYIMYIVAKEKFPELDVIEKKQTTSETKKEQVKANPIIVKVIEDNDVKVVEEKKVEVKETKQSKYSQEEIENARTYVGNYNHITNEINKSVLKCVSESGEKTEEVRLGCQMSAMRKFNMDVDPVSQEKLKLKYNEQLAIARSYF